MDNENANVTRFNEAAAEWDDDPKRVYMAQKIARAMASALSPAGTEQALEFGAGTGLLTLSMAPKVASVTALDSSGRMLDVLRGKCQQKGLTHVEAIEGSVPADLPDADFDIIYSSMTLHHVEDTAALFKALAGHLAPGGRVALADLDAEDGSFHGDATGVVHHGFQREAIADLLEQAGFVDVTFSTAHTAEREDEQGNTREFPIFLVVARHPSS
jgi:2-polyprenyl-3-methyl-5-hydroxy-6-metoxy-1,4-benzoquinol methylase